MKNSPGYGVCALFMLLLSGSLLTPAVDAQTEEGEASTNSAPGFPRRGTVTAETLNVRARPGLFYEVIAKLETGDKVQVLERQNDWYRIPAPKDAEAWVADRFVSEDNRITGDGVRVRAGTGVAFSAYHTLDQGTAVKPTGKTRDNWNQITPPDNATAWVSGQFIELEPTKTDPAEETNTDEEAAEAADQEAADETENGDSTSEQAGDGEAEESAIDEKQDAAEREEDEKAAEEESRVAEQTAEPESEVEDESKGKESAVVDLKEQDRTAQSSSDESREVEMLPPIRLPETETSNETQAEADTNVRTTPLLVTGREEKTSERETDSSLVYTEVISEDDDKDADVEADAMRAETETRRRRRNSMEEVEAEKPQPDEPRKTAEADKPEVPAAFRISGIVVSLGDRANEAASHVIMRSSSGRMTPVAYLRSHSVDLTEWEGRKLHVYGKRIPCDWSKPLVAVRGVLIAR